MKLKKVLEENYKVVLAVTAILFATVLLVFLPLLQKNLASEDLGKSITDDSVVILKHIPTNATLELEVASTPQKRQSGLMFINKLADNTGMFFIFPSETKLSFWMMNTSISLDMIFLNKDLKVTSISSNTKPRQIEETYDAKSNSQFVIETLAGWANSYNINEGDLFEIVSIK